MRTSTITISRFYELLLQVELLRRPHDDVGEPPPSIRFLESAIASAVRPER